MTDSPVAILGAIKGAVDQQAEALDAFKQANDERFEQLQERVEQIEDKGSRPGRTSNPQDEEHKELFEAWMRRPRDHQVNERLSNFQSAKAVTIATPADGGYAVPEEIGRQIEAKVLKLSPVRRLVKVSRAGTSDIKRLVDLRGAEGGWRSETGAANETGTPSLREVTPTGGELYAYPKVSNWSLEDIFFDVAGWLSDSVAEKFAQLEGQAVLTGNGSNTLTGMLNSTPTAVSDEAATRAAAVYEYILSGDNSPAAVDADSLIDLVYKVNAAYRNGAVFVMNSTTAGAVRKLKDSTSGLYTWQPGLVAGQPNLLLGYPVEIWEDLDDVLGGQHPVAFGNFGRAYELIDRSAITITVDPYTTPGYTKFYTRKRVYGHPLNNDAVKFLKVQ